MRSKSVTTLILGLMLAAIGISRAQTQLTLMPYTTEWRYLVTNALPTGWSASNYPAANGWPLGSAVLAFPANEAMPPGVPAVSTVLMTNFNSMIVTSFYFRASVTLTTAPNRLIITGSAVIDDGAVIYVNGREVQRVRMPTGAVNHRTLASAGGEVGARIDTFAIASSNFVQGANVIAAEVHQDAHTSSDVVFGMQLTAQLINPIVITSQPEDQTVDVGFPAVFSVTATGTSPSYQWFTNGVRILNATNASYTNLNSTLAMSGRIFHVVVTNLISSVRSSDAILTVVQDRNGPQMLSALATASNAVEITFNEGVSLMSATNNLSNYIVHLLGTTSTLTVTQAIWGGRVVRIRFHPVMDPDSNYVVCIYNIQDQLGNITSGDCIGITAPQIAVTNEVFSLGSEWRFHDFIFDNSISETNWTAFSFDDGDFASPNWFVGSGLFWNYINAPSSLCSVPSWELKRGPRTQYYRKKFEVPSYSSPLLQATNVTLVIRHIVDDGAIFYVNETEVGRFNMPAGPVNYNTVATPPITNNPACNTLFASIPATLLNVGTNNIIAVEVHQAEADPDGVIGALSFDAALSFSYRRTPVIPALRITHTRTVNSTNVIVTWVGSGWQLQHSTAPSGATWQNLASTVFQGTNRYSTIVPQQGQRRFYRLKNP